MKNRHVVYVFSLIAILLIFVAGYWAYFKQYTQGPVISDYQAARDREAVIALFKQNWWWLIAGRDFSRTYVEHMLDKRTSSKNPLLAGALKFRSLRVGNELVGFSVFYLEKKDTGRLLFLVIDENHRRKGYAEMLAKETMHVLQQMGAKRIWLLTRASNDRAQRLYRRLGFQEFLYDPDGFIHFEIMV